MTVRLETLAIAGAYSSPEGRHRGHSVITGFHMVRTIGGFAVLAVVAMLGFKLLMGLFGTLIGLLVTVLWWAFLGFVVYTLLKIFAPGLAQRIRDTIRGPSTT